MKTDALFHEFFQLVPQALFELLQIRPGCEYSFHSPVVKASERRLDGLLEPAEEGYPRFFMELQGYDDKTVYWRSVQEVGQYHAQRPNLNGTDWKMILLFLDKAYDPGPETLGPLYSENIPWLIRGNIPELLEQVNNPSPILHVLRPLIAKSENEVQQEAPIWAAEIRQMPVLEQATKERLLTLLTQFVVQKFSEASAKEIEKMLQLTPLEETRAVREWMQQGQISVLAQLIEEKFLIPASLASLTLASLNREALDELARQILRFQTADELAAWIEAHKTNGRDEGD
jgi:predicted transposase YdaD